ncbi:MAG: ATP-binding protein, partial [Ilumatobacteraceae bacterium]
DIADARFDEERRDLRTKEREMRVHWMHDDVLTEVKLAKLRVESSSDASAALREFDELDHRLRLRQLDESLRGGDVPLYEILQPHLRRVQSAGVRIERVPSLDQSSMRVDEETGRTIHRAVGNLVSNAITAGATTLSVSLLEHLDPHRVEISVTDDAGGFSLDDVEPGRGLWLLRRDLGDDAVEVVPVPDGSIVSVHVRLGPPADHRTQGAADDRRPRGDVLR